MSKPDDWLSNGLPTGNTSSHSGVRQMIDHLGGPSGFKTTRRDNADGSATTVQLKGDMPPQVTTTRVSSVQPQITIAPRTFTYQKYNSESARVANRAIVGGMEIVAPGIASGLYVNYFVAPTKTKPTAKWNDVWRLDSSLEASSLKINNKKVSGLSGLYFKGESSLPYLVSTTPMLLAIGNASVGSQGVRVFDADGYVLEAIELPTSVSIPTYAPPLTAGLLASADGEFSFYWADITIVKDWRGDEIYRICKTAWKTIGVLPIAPHVSTVGEGFKTSYLFDAVPNGVGVLTDKTGEYAEREDPKIYHAAIRHYTPAGFGFPQGDPSWNPTVERLVLRGYRVRNTEYVEGMLKSYVDSGISHAQAVNGFPGSPLALIANRSIAAHKYVYTHTRSTIPSSNPLFTDYTDIPEGVFRGHGSGDGEKRGTDGTASTTIRIDAVGLKRLYEVSENQTLEIVTNDTLVEYVYADADLTPMPIVPNFAFYYIDPTSPFALALPEIVANSNSFGLSDFNQYLAYNNDNFGEHVKFNTNYGNDRPIRLLSAPPKSPSVSSSKEHQTLDCTTRDYLLADMDEEVFIYLEVIYHSTTDTVVDTLGVATITRSAHLTATYKVETRMGDFEVVVFDGSYDPAIYNSRWSENDKGQYLRGYPGALAYTPAFTCQGNFPLVAYTTKAEEAAGALQEIYIDIDVGLAANVVLTQTGVLFAPVQLFQWIDPDAIDMLQIFVTLQPSVKIQFANGVQGPWRTQLGPPFIEEARAIEISRI